jgi:hypothetical protein
VYFLVAMIATIVYHMDPLCIVFMAMDISYIDIIHGPMLYLFGGHAYIILNHGNV